MYDTELTHISLPDEEGYIYTLGVAISVFMSVNGFIIENILHTDPTKSWHLLIDKTSGRLSNDIRDTITVNSGSDISDMFSKCVDMRNRIIHGFRCTDKDDKQIVITKDETGKQYLIDKAYLERFIDKCNELNQKLYQYRKDGGYLHE